MKISNHTSAIIIAIVFISLLALAWKPIFGWHQPYINWAPWDLAEHLAEHGRSPRECLDLIYFEIMSPSEAEQQALCVYEYAKLTKDPSACELLMPSSYGLYCVGGAQSEPDLCSMSNGEVKWKDGSETYASCASLTKNRTKDGSACCLIARVAFVKSENDCSSLKGYSGMYDACLQSLAFKNHDPVVCAGISNANTKSACTVNAEAIRKDPSICKGCKVRVETLDQLK